MVRALWLDDDGDAAQTPGWRDLRAYMAASGLIQIERATRFDRLQHLGEFDVVVAHTTRLPNAEQSEALEYFVRHGKGLICLGETVAAWQDGEICREMLGAVPAAPTPATEIIGHVAGDHDITRRLDATIMAYDTASLFVTLPDDATPLIQTTWRFSPATLAYLRPWESGQVMALGLGMSEATLQHRTVQQMLYRAACYLAGWREGDPVGVALLGYGAIGYEHGQAIRATPGLELRVACDRNPARLEAAQTAFPELRVTTEIDAVMDDDTIHAVVVGTPPNTHAPLAQQLLAAGKHVVVEKPFCLTTAEAGEMIALAHERGLALTVYQNRRWDPDFLAIREVAQAGTIGDIFHMETFIGGFSHPCDFWHSHEPISGGVFYDWGSHYLDWMLNLMPGEVSDVRAGSHKRVWHDVTNADQANLWLRFTGGEEAIFIHSDVAALLKPKWYILGTRGAIVGQWRHASVTTRAWSGDLIEERLAPSESLPIVTVATRTERGQIHEQRLDLPPAPLHPFHRNFADHVLAGEPLAVPPESSRRNIAVMEAAAYSAAHGAEIVRLGE
jgi:scyllo-inositol 2-dehydrogenase (NADP+)